MCQSPVQLFTHRYVVCEDDFVYCFPLYIDKKVVHDCITAMLHHLDQPAVSLPPTLSAYPAACDSRWLRSEQILARDKERTFMPQEQEQGLALFCRPLCTTRDSIFLMYTCRGFKKKHPL